MRCPYTVDDIRHPLCRKASEVEGTRAAQKFAREEDEKEAVQNAPKIEVRMGYYWNVKSEISKRVTVALEIILGRTRNGSTQY